MKIMILQKQIKHPDCIDEKYQPSEEDLKKAKKQFAFLIKADIKENGPKFGYVSKKTGEAYCVGNSYEECLEVFFKKQDSWKYCNEINLILPKSEDKKAFDEYFYGKGGISNYARLGGDMW
jgi:hypothetical protein